MRKNLSITLVALLSVVGIMTGSRLHAQEQQSKPQQTMPDCPMMKKTGMEGMNERGEKGMGFSQEKTTHHFYLTKTGGIIQVEADAADDVASRDQIRRHLAAIARAFAAGDFRTPQGVHARVPPGAPEMQRLKAVLSYDFEALARGGRVVIRTPDREARAAVHRFLRFQIEEHQTGDPLEVER